MSQVGQWPPHLRLSEAVGAHTVPAINLWNFLMEVWELLPCANERACFSKGAGRRKKVHGHLFVCLWKRARKALADNEDYR